MTTYGISELASCAIVPLTGGTIFFALTDVVIGQAITGFVTIVVAIVSAYFAWKAKQVSDETHKAVNARMDDFKKMAEEFFITKGVIKEKDAEVLRKAEVVVATAAAVAALPMPVAPVVSVAKEPVTLNKIETNTAATAANTAKTDATVQEIKEHQ